MEKDVASTAFSAREIRYLQSLPAVERVSQGRIHYTEGFKRDCIRQYNAGESPARIFRRAGLDSSLIGYKRIERCIARWKRSAGSMPSDDASGGDGSKTSFEIPESQRWMQPVTLPVGVSRRAEDDASGDMSLVRDLSELLGDRVRQVAGERGVYGLIIVQQARRIEQLERQLEQIREEMHRGMPKQ